MPRIAGIHVLVPAHSGCTMQCILGTGKLEVQDMKSTLFSTLHNMATTLGGPPKINIIPLILPLIIQTFLFKLYLNRRHYSVTRCLPMAMCSLIDGNSENEGVTDASLKDAYLQPGMKSSFNQRAVPKTAMFVFLNCHIKGLHAGKYKWVNTT